MSNSSTPLDSSLTDSSSTEFLSDESLPAISLARTAVSPAVLPPFRSTTEFPRDPKPDQLLTLYSDCLHALHEANSARKIHKRRLEIMKQVISAIRLEIERLEKDLVLEAGTRVKLHAMNLRLFAALQEMDDLTANFDGLVHEAHQVPRSSLGRLIDRLKALIKQWLLLRRRQRQELAGIEGSQQDEGLP